MENPGDMQHTSETAGALREMPLITSFVREKGISGLPDWIGETFASGGQIDDYGIELVWSGLRLLVQEGQSAADVAWVIVSLGSELSAAFSYRALMDDLTRPTLGVAQASAPATLPDVLQFAQGHPLQMAQLLSAMNETQAGFVLARAAETTPAGAFLTLSQLPGAAPGSWQKVLAAAVRDSTEAMASILGGWLSGAAAADAVAVGKALSLTTPAQATEVLAGAGQLAGAVPAGGVLLGLWGAAPATAAEAWGGLADDIALSTARAAVDLGIHVPFFLEAPRLHIGAALLSRLEAKAAYKALAAVEAEDGTHAEMLAVEAASNHPALMADVVGLMLSHGRSDVPALLASVPAPAAVSLFAAVDWEGVGAPLLLRVLTGLRQTSPEHYHALATGLAAANPDVLTKIGKSLAADSQWRQLAIAMNDLGNIQAAAAILVAVAVENGPGAASVLKALAEPVTGSLKPESVLETAFAHPQAMLPTAILLASNPHTRRMLIQSLDNTPAATAAEVYGGIIDDSIDHPEATIEFLETVHAHNAAAAGEVLALIMGMAKYRPAMAKLAARLILNGENGIAFLVKIMLVAPADSAVRLCSAALIYLDSQIGDGDGHFIWRTYLALQGQAILAQLLDRIGAKRPALLARLLNRLASEAETVGQAVAIIEASGNAAASFVSMTPANRLAVLPLLSPATVKSIAGSARSVPATAVLLEQLHATGRSALAIEIVLGLGPAFATGCLSALSAEARDALVSSLDAVTVTNLVTSDPEGAPRLIKILFEMGATNVMMRVLGELASQDAAAALNFFKGLAMYNRGDYAKKMSDTGLTNLIREPTVDAKIMYDLVMGAIESGRTDLVAGLLKGHPLTPELLTFWKIEEALGKRLGY